MNQNKIKDQFHYFNIQTEIDSVYGNWAVSTNGDVVNCLYPYAILAIHFTDTDWLKVMRNKVWFKPECEDALRHALDRAKEIQIQDILRRCRINIDFKNQQLTRKRSHQNHDRVFGM